MKHLQVHERRLAEEEGYESPVHATADDTHANYNRCVRILIQEAATTGAEVMIATHNQYSVEMAVRVFSAELRLCPVECSDREHDRQGRGADCQTCLSCSGCARFRFAIAETASFSVFRTDDSIECWCRCARCTTLA